MMPRDPAGRLAPASFPASASAMTPRDAILEVLSERQPGKSICPSEAARRAGGESWRALLPEIREAGRALAAEGRIEVTKKGRPVDPSVAKGVIRYRLAAEDPSP